MRNFIDPFLYNTPRIDVHGYDRTGAVAVLKSFIDDYIKIKEEKIIIVHGKGEGILRHSIHEYLRTEKRVKEFKLNNYNDGETIIYLNY